MPKASILPSCRTLPSAFPRAGIRPAAGYTAADSLPHDPPGLAMNAPDSPAADPDSLAGSTAVVTGASGGIGRAIALELARAGADLVVHARASLERLRETAEQVRALGRACLELQADLAEPAEQDRLAEAAWNWHGGVKSWVNNAGADLLTGAAAKLPFDRKLEILHRVDVTATLRLSRNIGTRMRDGAGGAIVNVGWDQAWQGMAGDSGELFAASKGAIMAFSRSLALSLGPRVRVNCVAPGWIKTAWGEQAPVAWQERAIKEAALARWGLPEDVARVVRFLVGPAAGFVTGQIVNVNGGFKAS